MKKGGKKSPSISNFKILFDSLDLRYWPIQIVSLHLNLIFKLFSNRYY